MPNLAKRIQSTSQSSLQFQQPYFNNKVSLLVYWISEILCFQPEKIIADKVFGDFSDFPKVKPCKAGSFVLWPLCYKWISKPGNHGVAGFRTWGVRKILIIIFTCHFGPISTTQFFVSFGLFKEWNRTIKFCFYFLLQI